MSQRNSISCSLRLPCLCFDVADTMSFSTFKKHSSADLHVNFHGSGRSFEAFRSALKTRIFAYENIHIGWHDKFKNISLYFESLWAAEEFNWLLCHHILQSAFPQTIYRLIFKAVSLLVILILIHYHCCFEQVSFIELWQCHIKSAPLLIGTHCIFWYWNKYAIRFFTLNFFKVFLI